MVKNSTLGLIGGGILVLITLFFLLKLFNYGSIKNQHYGSVHAWRQADCESLTYQIYNGSGSLIYPSTHYVKSDLTNYAAGEFPIINGIVAMCYRLFGFHESYYRNTILFFYACFLIFLFALYYRFTQHWLASYLGTFLIGLSPILVYYSFNVLPDVPALCIATMGIYYVLIPGNRNSLKLLAGICLLGLASLVKLSFIVLLIGSVIPMFQFYHRTGKASWLGWKGMVAYFINLLLVFLWYYHAYKLDHRHPPFIFLTESRSWWSAQVMERKIIWKAIKESWLPIFYVPYTLLFWIGSLLMILKAGWKSIQSVFIFWVICFIGYACIFLLLFKQFRLHDYLLIGFIPLLFILHLQVITYVYSQKIRALRLSVTIITIVLIVMQLFLTRREVYQRYFQFDNSWAYNQDLWEFRNHKDSFHIQPKDMVISIPDPSPNMTLMAMDLKGFTSYRGENSTTESILNHSRKGAKYLIVTKESELVQDYLKPFLPYYVGRFKSIYIYNLENANFDINRNKTQRGI